ncbi:hypothetical protein IF188_00230 [Microbacterium sp. NEAU-LLC]|uniref:DUF4386 domain-containing protein n=1 Tax=Microbacterium helvum TaxID=2773713 RepID=A0ABR8NJM6_9MICO|nr:hypothetical protein [Microbacterium helvum]MBD3940123.1 hypothetical protein [Microbacterium helvum]
MTAAVPATGNDVTAHTSDARGRVPLWACGLLGLGAFVIGLLPWLVTGMRLPLQNLWASTPGPEGMPVALLPFSQYHLTDLFALIAVGSVVAGIIARALRPRLARGGIAVLAGAVLVAQVVAVAQSAIVVSAGLQQRSESALYLGGLVAVCALSFLLGAAALALVALAPRGGALIGLTIGALAMASWVGVFLRPLMLTGPDWLLAVASALQWLAPVLVGAAIAWAGVNTVGRVLAAVASLALLWVVPAGMTGVSAAAGTRVLAHDVRGMIDYAVNVFRMALFTPELALRPIVAAVAVAAVGLLLRWAVARARRSPEPEPVPGSAPAGEPMA